MILHRRSVYISSFLVSSLAFPSIFKFDLHFTNLTSRSQWRATRNPRRASDPLRTRLPASWKGKNMTSLCAIPISTPSDMVVLAIGTAALLILKNKEFQVIWSIQSQDSGAADAYTYYAFVHMCICAMRLGAIDFGGGVRVYRTRIKARCADCFSTADIQFQFRRAGK
ncbi:hypothetical protein B0H13DRAFT_1947053 [Mycena leptocephala]|nr:hypothetical protein B0H13DRAFT_1947053 [Mycena leptocephala]